MSAITEKKLRKAVATQVFGTAPNIEIYYHGTCVVQTTAEKITLNHGGFTTATTVKRMNQAAEIYNLPYRVFCKNYVMYVATKCLDGSYNFKYPRSFKNGRLVIDRSI